MKSLTRWPVTVSYYDRDAKAKDGEQTPVYAMSFELFENGVSRALVLDYNDFVISGAMGKFDVKDSKPCKLHRGACRSPARQRPRWLRLLLLLRLLRPVIGNAPDHRGIAEFLAQIVHRAFGMGRAAVEHVGVVGLRARRAAR